MIAEGGSWIIDDVKLIIWEWLVKGVVIRKECVAGADVTECAILELFKSFFWILVVWVEIQLSFCDARSLTKHFRLLVSTMEPYLFLVFYECINYKFLGGRLEFNSYFIT